MNQQTILWKQKIDAPIEAWTMTGFFLGVTIILSIYIIKFSQLLTFNFYGIATFIIGLCPILFGTYWLIQYNKTALVSSSICYKITSEAIHFEWKEIKEKQVAIPFQDITSINLVEYEDRKDATIFFSTKKDYPIHKLNFEKMNARHTYTFEKVLDGQKVYQLLKSQWQKVTN